MDLGLGQESSGPSGESEYSLSSSPLTRARYRHWSDPLHIKQPRDKGWAARKKWGSEWTEFLNGSEVSFPHL